MTTTRRDFIKSNAIAALIVLLVYFARHFFAGLFCDRDITREHVALTAIMVLAACVRSNPEIVELEINPLFAYENGAVAVDVRAML